MVVCGSAVEAEVVADTDIIGPCGNCVVTRRSCSDHNVAITTRDTGPDRIPEGRVIGAESVVQRGRADSNVP